MQLSKREKTPRIYLSEKKEQEKKQKNEIA